jgi:hypothetical protein
MRIVGGFTFVVFGILAITLTIVVGAPTFPGWAGIAGVMSVIAGIAVWRSR